jgi:CRISPR-associated protein Csd2
MSNNTTNTSIPRITGLLVIEARNSNPNGDPDRESDPRTRAHDGRGVISDVSFKRKLRELVLNKEGPVWRELQSKLALNQDEFQIHVDQNTRNSNRGAASVLAGLKADWQNAKKEADKNDSSDASKQAAVDAYDVYIGEIKRVHFDIRVFGSTALEGGDNFIRTGVAQFGIGVSCAKVRIQRDTNTVKANVDADKDADRGMAPLGFRVVEHGVYAMPFLVNPTAAVHSGCTRDDIELLCRLIPYAYAHNSSRIRPFVEVRHAWYFEHMSPLGSASDFAILDALTPKKGDLALPSTLWEDYHYDAKKIAEKITTDFAGKFGDGRFGDLCSSEFVSKLFPHNGE